MDEENDLYYGDLNDKGSLNPSSIATEEVAESNQNTDNVGKSLKESASEVTMSPPLMVPIAMPFLHLYPIDNYTFGSKEAMMEVETSYHNRMAHLADSFKNYGMRRTVEAVMLTYENNHPHVLLFQLGDSTVFKLPGDTIKAGEEEFTVLPSRLDDKLSPTGAKNSWNIDPECLGVWYRPNFDNPVYPYVPAHVTRPKERITLFLVRLPSNQTFAVPKNVKMMAIPLCDLYDNAARYGPIIASLPHLLSKFNIINS